MKKTSKKEASTHEEFTGRTDDRAQHQQIAERAYALHQKRGGHHGQDLEDWLEAERIILSEQSLNSKEATHVKPAPAPRGRNIQKLGGQQRAASE